MYLITRHVLIKCKNFTHLIPTAIKLACVHLITQQVLLIMQKNYTHINSNTAHFCVLIMQTLHTHQQPPLSLVCWPCTNDTHINSSTTHLCVSTNKAGFANTSIPNKHHLEQVLVVLHASVSISSCLTRINLDTCCTFPFPTSLHLDQVNGSETTYYY